jgi:positive regulator of sigma E activity
MKQAIVISVWIVAILIGAGVMSYYYGINDLTVFLCLIYITVLTVTIAMAYDRFLSDQSRQIGY